MSLLRTMLNVATDTYRYMRFPNAFIAFRGVYESFESALANKPKQKERGQTYSQAKSQDSASLTQLYSKPVSMVGTEYPLFFWLDRICTQLRQNGQEPNVCDFGGGNGRHYFAYTSHSKQKPLWRVCELEQNVKVGREITAGLKLKNLHFVENLDEPINADERAQKCNILLSSGAFQYVENIYHLLSEHLTGGGDRAYSPPTLTSAR